ncbi:hypothetical protein AND_000065 [Anopheles darlingi]|uniref:Uncharacterized protein n=1 Tax=Anopheles darlingi TaxID=43151 RepID=W5JV98_ANODA|nr:hypothetical protein AND_000065 [Anopheles darlingi]
MNSTISELERYWKVLVANYLQCKNLNATKNWAWYDEMVFLDDYLPKTPKITSPNTSPSQSQSRSPSENRSPSQRRSPSPNRRAM